MPRARSRSSNHLPPYVMQRSGRYYLEPKGQMREMLGGRGSIPLGKSYGEMFQNYGRLLEVDDSPSEVVTLSQLVHDYLRNVSAVERAPQTFQTDLKTSKQILKVFVDFLPDDIQTVHIYDYMRRRKRQVSNRTVNKEVSFLSGVMRYAAELGIIERSPCFQIRYLPVKPRDRYITDQELDDFCEYAALRHPMASAYMRFRYVTGRRDCEVRSVLFEHVLEEGIIFLIAKRASGGERVPVLMEWTQKLREAFNELVRACWGPEVGEVNTPSYSPPKGEAPVVSYSAGKPYTGEGWRTAFQRLMVGAMKDGVLSRRFTSHDIRAKTATDIEDLADASNTLAHSDIRTTKINYRRKIERIRPLEK